MLGDLLNKSIQVNFSRLTHLNVFSKAIQHTRGFELA